MFEFWKMIVDEGLSAHFIVTGIEALCGILLGTILGSISGLYLWYSNLIQKILMPYVLALSSFPIFAFAPLLIVWFGLGMGMKIAIAAFATFFISLSQANKGASSVSQTSIDTLLGMRADKKDIFRKIIVPGSIEWVLNSTRLNVGTGLMGAFIGEFISSQSGLGYLILRASGLYNVSRAIAASLGIVILAFLFDYIAKIIEKRRYTLVQYMSIPTIYRK